MKSSKISRSSPGIWLCLIVLMASAVAVIRIDSRRNDPPFDSPGESMSVSNGSQVSPDENNEAPLMQVKPTNTAAAASRLLARKPIPVEPANSPLIRVNVTPGGTTSIQLEIRGPYSIRSVGTAAVLGKGDNLSAVKVQSTSTGLKIGKTAYSSTQLELVSRQNPGIRVDGHLYRGTVRLFRRKDGQVSAVNVLPLEEYLASVVDSEMPAAFPEAARQAQAIVSRTYALYQMDHADPAAVYDLFSSQRSQKYLGVEYCGADGRRLAGESESSRRAVAATRGMVCKHRGELFCTYYSAVCGGRTTNGAEIFSDAAPVLKSVPCEFCRDSEYYRWTTELDRKELLKQVSAALTGIVSIRQTAGPGDGGISKFRLADGKKSIDVTGVQLREQFPTATLRSPHFSLTLGKTHVRADGRGHGHGVGFCQWGARGQGLQGHSARVIVLHYYPGAEIVVIDY